MTKIIVRALELTDQRGIINKGWGGLGNCKMFMMFQSLFTFDVCFFLFKLKFKAGIELFVAIENAELSEDDEILYSDYKVQFFNIYTCLFYGSTAQESGLQFSHMMINQENGYLLCLCKSTDAYVSFICVLGVLIVLCADLLKMEEGEEGQI